MATDFAKQYEKEHVTGRLVLMFTILALITVCLGLYGMTAFTLGTKKLKFCLLKINGATSSEVCSGIMKEFLVLVLGSFVVVSPLFYLSGTRWLMQFPYGAEISLWVFRTVGIGPHTDNHCHYQPGSIPDLQA